jgi:hypothetical protein
MRRILFALCLAMSALSAVPPHGLPEVRLVPVTRTPEPDHVEIEIAYPRQGEVKGGRAEVQLRLDGFPLGVKSDFPRSSEIYNNPRGQALHVVVDNRPYFSKYVAFVSVLEDFENYYEQKLEFDLQRDLEPGMHVIRVFPVRSFNESLKGDGCFKARVFYVQSREKKLDVDLNGPYLTYNEPQGSFRYSPKRPILLDFYLTNCQLSEDGYKVRLSIDGRVEETIHQWVPFYIYGLKSGSHTVRLELLDSENKIVPGLFNDVQRTIEIQ